MVKTDGVNQSNINAKKIGAYKFAMPNIKEQIEIVRILDDMFAKEQQVKQVAETVVEQIDLIKNLYFLVLFEVSWERTTKTRKVQWSW